ncbi:MAG: flagellar M-ring protein FliF [Oscillospiraceae bacterium]|nr:flagellar M-ring protein FliF [Oscillospiraceae bacterium]
MENNTNKVKENIEKIKEYIAKLSKRSKTIIAIGGAALVLLALIFAIVANVGKGKYTVLYTDLSASETGSVFQALKSMGADAQIDKNGNITVPTDEYDIWLLQLAAKGYPQTALPYDLFSDHAGMTSTESEKSQWLIYQLQDRIQATLQRLDGVENATVTITVPESSGYVWETATSNEKASAGVLLSIRDGVTISVEQVTAMKNLIAASVPKMLPEDVTVVDAKTMLDLSVSTVSEDNADQNAQNLAFELMVQNQIEANVVRLLSPRYGDDGVVAVAKVTIDYDKMMTEKYELQPKNEEGDGYLTHSDGDYTINGEEPVGELVGEENNTDIPEYGYNNPGDEDGITDYHWNNDYDYGYIKTQIESGNAILKRATISVMVAEESLTPNRREELTNLVSRSTDIPTDQIFVSAINLNAPSGVDDIPSATPTSPFADLPTWVYIAAGAGALVLLIIICVVIAVVKRRKKQKLARALEEEERQRAEAERRQQAEINDYKRSLEDMAKANLDPKNEAIIEEVRSFARSNPQVTANLLRNWLKEE